jgi:hypothetical protein
VPHSFKGQGEEGEHLEFNLSIGSAVGGKFS